MGRRDPRSPPHTFDGESDPPVDPRAGKGVRGGLSVPDGRLGAIRLQDRGPRGDVGADRRRLPRRTIRLADPVPGGGPGAVGLAVPRHGVRTLRQLRRRRLLATPPTGPSQDPRHRPGHPGALGRSGRGHPGAWILDPRRPDPAPAISIPRKPVRRSTILDRRTDRPGRAGKGTTPGITYSGP